MKLKNIAYSGLLIAIGVVLPQVFHIFGQQVGQTFLPMHIPIIIAGLVVGPWYGIGVAIATPIISSLFTTMPPVPMLYFMIFELSAYALAAGILAKKIKLNIYINLLITLVFGRLVYGLTLVVAVAIFGMSFKFANTTAFFMGIVNGLPGIAIQLIFIPPIIFALKKGGLALAKAKGTSH